MMGEVVSDLREAAWRSRPLRPANAPRYDVKRATRAEAAELGGG